MAGVNQQDLLTAYLLTVNALRIPIVLRRVHGSRPLAGEAVLEQLLGDGRIHAVDPRRPGAAVVVATDSHSLTVYPSHPDPSLCDTMHRLTGLTIVLHLRVPVEKGGQHNSNRLCT